jgi:putative glutamine amidotransferase
MINPEMGLEGTRPTYPGKVIKYDIIPLFVSYLMTKKMLDELYNEADGLYLTGGDDWNPELYGEKRHPQTEAGEPQREKIELYLLNKALKDHKPILAICRGAQGLVVATGGKLIQHLPDEFPQENHRLSEKMTYGAFSKTKLRHPVIIKKGTKTYKLLQKETVMVNSLHHQAPRILGKDFVVSGTSPQGVIEVFEHKDPAYFCIGIQSHPEIEEPSFFEPLFEAFAKAVKKHE